MRAFAKPADHGRRTAFRTAPARSSIPICACQSAPSSSAKEKRPSATSFPRFNATGLADRLRGLGVRRVLIVGLALDVCVLETALDAISEGFETHVRLSGARAITPEGGRDAVEKMRKAGVVVEES